MSENQNQSPQGKAVTGAGSLQRSTEGSDAKDGIRKNIRKIREGHLTGGYCESEALQAEEKKLYAILATELEAAKQKHGYSPDPKFKHTKVRELELEINGLSWKPRLVVATE